MSALFNRTPPRNAAGAIQVTDAATVPDHHANGLPYEASNRLAVDTVSAINHHHQGLAFTANGRIAATLVGPPITIEDGARPIDATGRVVLAIGANAHFIHGVGYTPNSSINVET